MLGACAPDAPTAPRATPGAPAHLLVPAGYTQVTAGLYHTCALGGDGAVTCWGGSYWYNYGQATPTFGLSRVVQVSAGKHHTCAVTAAGAVACWGDDVYGGATPPAGTGYTQVSAGGEHSCALTTAGTVTCWGRGDKGQTTVPAGLSGVTQVSAGNDHTCALGVGGAVTCWGANDTMEGYAGQATPPAGLGAVVQVSARGDHACALTTAGTVTCWGDPRTGAPPAGLGGVVQVSAGNYHACARTAAGLVTCWGNGYAGNLTPPDSLGSVVQVSVGGAHACALDAAGVVTCWGDNVDGQAVPTPGPPAHRVTPVGALRHPAGVIAGRAFTIAFDDAHVPGHPEATRFTYAFDCGTGTYAAASAADSTSCPATAAGPLTVRGKVIDQDGDTAVASGTVRVDKAPQFLRFTSTPPSPAPVGATYAVSATATSGLAVALSSLTPAACTVAGTTVTFVAAGPCTLAADQAGSDVYLAAPQVIQTFTVVSKQPQAITFTAPASARIDARLTLAATGGASGNPVVFRSLTPAMCGVSGAVVTFGAVGPCTLAADQAGSDAYEAAPRVTRTVAGVWPFTGFAAPVQNPPAVTVVKAGRAVPLTFALGGDRGRAVLAAGAPTSAPAACPSGTPRGAGAVSGDSGAGLTYNAATGQYTYFWTTDKAWAGTCRLLTLTLADGTSHQAGFQFTK